MRGIHERRAWELRFRNRNTYSIETNVTSGVFRKMVAELSLEWDLSVDVEARVSFGADIEVDLEAPVSPARNLEVDLEARTSLGAEFEVDAEAGVSPGVEFGSRRGGSGQPRRGIWKWTWRLA